REHALRALALGAFALEPVPDLHSTALDLRDARVQLLTLGRLTALCALFGAREPALESLGRRRERAHVALVGIEAAREPVYLGALVALAVLGLDARAMLCLLTPVCAMQLALEDAGTRGGFPAALARARLGDELLLQAPRLDLGVVQALLDGREVALEGAHGRLGGFRAQRGQMRRGFGGPARAARRARAALAPP